MGRFKCIVLMVVILVIASGLTYADTTYFYISNGVLQNEVPAIQETDDVKKVEILGDGYSRLINYADGYTLDIPSDMVIDVTLSPVRTVVANDQTQIEIYHDDFQGTVHSGNSYSIYSNKEVFESSWHQIAMNKTIRVGNCKAKVISWSRKKLTHVEDDMNHYLSVEYFKSWNDVYTVFVKSTHPITNYERIIQSFKSIEKQGTPQFARRFSKRSVPVNKELRTFYSTYFSDESPLTWGIFHPPSPGDMDDLNALEERLNYEFDILVRYHTFDSPVPLEELQAAYDEGKYLELTLQTMYYGRSDNDNMLYRILDGEFDWYLTKYAQDLKTFGHPVLFRLNNEMNGDWCVYSAYHHGKDTELYKEAWQYIHDLFQQQGTDNVLWVWNPHDLSFPGFKWNHYLNYFPGEKYVDIVGLTGYNTGTYYKGEVWRSFDDIYPEIYKAYVQHFNYPLMITEFGSNNVGGDKVGWIQDMFTKMATYDRIKIAIWFNGTDLDSHGNPARVYRLDNSEEVMDVFRTHFTTLESPEMDPKETQKNDETENEELLDEAVVEDL